MRLAPALILATLLATLLTAPLAGPALAQDTTTPAAPAVPAPAPVPPPDVATIGPNADRDFWCALAYSLTARAAQIGSDETGAMAETGKSQMLFASIVTTMKAGSFGEAEFNALTAKYTIEMLDPFATPKYTREQCETALVDAKAILDAAEAAAPTTEQPAAPAADAPPA